VKKKIAQIEAAAHESSNEQEQAETVQRNGHPWRILRRMGFRVLAQIILRINSLVANAPKTQPNSHVKPQNPKKRTDKSNKQLRLNNLQAKNKPAKTGILVSPHSIK